MTNNVAQLIDYHDKAVAARREIKAKPEVIFNLLADPRAHCRFDGSGTVQGNRVNAPARLSLGATFGMDMKIGPLPYPMSNKVVEFAENELIAWSHFGDHIWRYELAPTESGTLVTESFDWSKAKAPFIYRPLKLVDRNQQAMLATLDRLAEVVAPRIIE